MSIRNIFLFCAAFVVAVQTGLMAALAVPRVESGAQAGEVLTLLLLSGLGGLGLALLAAGWLARQVAGPLGRAAALLECFGSDQAIGAVRMEEKGSAEMVRLARAVNGCMGEMSGIMERIALAASRLVSALEVLSAAATDTHRSMQSQAAETEQIATAMNEMSATVHEVAANTAHAAHAATEAEHETGSGQAVVGRAVATIEEVARDVRRVSEVVQEVEGDSERIGGVLDVIMGIAEQTNLLALNAAIEAARAGDHGRGFAVVADEVRTLAQRTQNSTQEIRAMIESLQRSARSAVEAMESGLRSTAASVREAEAAGAALDAITGAVDRISQMNIQIATASEEQSAVADEINRNIVRISELTTRTTAESGKTNLASEALVGLADELLAAVARFHLGERQIVIDLERAKTAHLSWKVRLRGFLDGRTSLTMAQAVSDRECNFGKWYFSSASERYAHFPEMQAIRDPHAQMHQLIHRIISLKNEGRLAQAEGEFKRVDELSRRIVGLLEALRQKVVQA